MPSGIHGIMSSAETVNQPTSSVLVDNLVSRILALKSPDDLEVTTLASEIKVSIKEEEKLNELVMKLCESALNSKEATPVIGAVCGQVGVFQVGNSKLRSLLMQKVQRDFSEKEKLETSNRSQFVASAMFLGEIFYHLKSDQGIPFKFLAEPVLVYLSMISKLHLSNVPGQDVDEEMVVVAKQLLQNGDTLYQIAPKELEDLIRDVTEIMIRHSLSDATRLNLLAALGDLWPKVNQTLNPRTLHASLAAKLGLSLKI